MPLVMLQSGQQGQTVWTVRFETAPQRGSYLMDPTSGVLVGLVGMEGNSLLHRISAVHNPEEINAELQRILKVLPWSANSAQFCTSASQSSSHNLPYN